MKTQTSLWIHFAQLENYIKEQLASVCFDPCLSYNKKCLQFDVSLVGTKQKCTIKTYFDLVLYNNMVLLEPIDEWIKNQSYCQIETVNFSFSNELHSLGQEYVELELVVYPCKRRAF